MNIFHRYTVRDHVAPFVFAFSVIMFVLILKFMLQMMDMITTKGVGIVVVAKLFLYNLPWMIALVVPMSVLIATLMTFGRMGAYGEITAMKAAGVSMYRLISPVVLISILITLIMVWFNNEILPVANYRASNIRNAIMFKSPMLSLKNREGQFISDLPKITIRVKKIDYDTGEMSGVTLFKQDGKDYETTIIAEKGRFEAYQGGGGLALVLLNGEFQRISSDKLRNIRGVFDEFRQFIKVDFNLDISRSTLKHDRTMKTSEMKLDIEESEDKISKYENQIKKISESSSTGDAETKRYQFMIENEKRLINRYLVEIHKKNSIPVAAIIFVLIGASLGILVKRSGASIGIGMSIGFFTLYYLFLIGGESAGDRMILEPWLAMWLPNFVFAVLGIALIIYANRR